MSKTLITVEYPVKGKYADVVVNWDDGVAGTIHMQTMLRVNPPAGEQGEPLFIFYSYAKEGDRSGADPKMAIPTLLKWDREGLTQTEMLMHLALMEAEGLPTPPEEKILAYFDETDDE